jgi:hypothetical protein
MLRLLCDGYIHDALKGLDNECKDNWWSPKPTTNNTYCGAEACCARSDNLSLMHSVCRYYMPQ